MTWNYRVMKHETPIFGTDQKEVWFGIHEVHYQHLEVDDLKVTADEVGYTEDAIVIADDVDGLRWCLNEMLKGLEKPVLVYDDETPAKEVLAARGKKASHGKG